MMKKSMIGWFLIALGAFAMLIGALDPIEGVFIIFPGSILAAIGAWLTQTSGRRWFYGAEILILLAFAIILIIDRLGGFGPKAPTLDSNAWGLLLLPYPLGWLAGMIGMARILITKVKKPLGVILGCAWGLITAGLLTRIIILIGFH